MSSKSKLRSDYVRPLCMVENDFLEVLVSEFELRRTPTGVVMSLKFDEMTDAIWNSKGRTLIRDQRTKNKFQREAAEHQAIIDNFFAGKAGNLCRYSNDGFPFRYGSGGVLPVVRMRGKDYVCLVYRECFPVGWNIFNGGTDSRTEMLNPLSTAAREFREELIIVDLENQIRYVHDMDSSDPEDMPEHVLARRLWTERLVCPVDIGCFDTLALPTQWLGGPDAIDVSIGKSSRLTRGCYLNINAEDFGIEIDRIARICVADNSVFLDGELLGEALMGSAIGLFELDAFQKKVTGARPGTEFLPDIFFFDGMRHEDPDVLLRVLSETYVPQVKALLPDWDAQAEWFDVSVKKFGLCPVTRNLVRRLPAPKTASTAASCDVFVSFATEDAELAKTVADFLDTRSRKNVFFSPNLQRSYFGTEIHRALESASCLVAVGSRIEHLHKEWVKYEHDAFHGQRMNHGKSDTNLVPYVVAGIDPKRLPLPLATYNAVIHNPVSPESSLEELLRYVLASKR